MSAPSIQPSMPKGGVAPRVRAGRPRPPAVLPRAFARKRPAQRGVTLLELIIAISLVGLISAGMLTAMRTSLMTNEKVAARLTSNRQRMNLRQTIVRQLGGAMPVMGPCGGGTVALFQGTTQTLRFVSSFSLAEGSRGYPQMVEYRVVPGAAGSRLMVSEQPYTGPASAAPFCADGGAEFAPGDASAVIAADRLSRCEFSYLRPLQQFAFIDAQWEAEWNQPFFPPAVKIEMASIDGAAEPLPPLSVTVNLHADRDFRGAYADR
jgi:prepilin-type N-terminal cleavage/methylation domain-containing protein